MKNHQTVQEGVMKNLSKYLKWMLVLSGIVLMMCSSPTKEKEITVMISDVWFSDAVDNDNDSYNSSARLNFDVDVSEGVITLFVKLGLRITDPSNVAPFTLYLESTDFSITGSSPDDAVYISIGIPNDELAHGNYDFLLQVFSSANPDKVMDEVSSVSDAGLRNVALETSTEDINVLTEWLSRTDGTFEGGVCYFGASDILSTAWYAISFDQPAGAQTCVVKKIRINIFSDPSYGKLRVWGILQSLSVPANLEIYSPTTSVYLNNGSNVFDVDINATLYNPFYVGYLQTQADKPQLSVSAEHPIGTFGRSRYYKNGIWNLVRTNEFGIDVFVEYTDSTGKILPKPTGRWLSGQIAGSSNAE
ncbi:MAG: hypothetical protein A2Y94_15335 [Caldithrix sp. RBG_13_44_9]|nr:MAG: hypothetical protein A2Y94_15335 [Caldithrix sp. RBG_13_44_9]